MSGSAVVVYTGPTISADEVRAVLPDAEVRPPAARGDLLDRAWRPGEVAVLVDGHFREKRSVGHKEVLRLLGSGVEVVGTASMGALRAAELAGCGMRGLGEVFAMYRSGEIDGDDEVGILHGPAERGYPARTVALVNLRHAVAADAVPAEAGARIVAAAKALPFTFRSWDELAAVVAERDRPALRTLRDGIESGRWDVKRQDAVAALRAIAAGLPPAPAPPSVTFPGISDHQVLVRRSRREYAPGRWMSDMDVLNAARLFDPDHPARHERVLRRLLDEIAGLPGAEAFARIELGVDGPLPPALAAWLTDAERARLGPGEQATTVLLRVWPVWQSADWRPAILADLRAGRDWERWRDLVVRADAAAEQARYRLATPPPAACAHLFLRHWRAPGTRPEIEMARRGFAGPEELGEVVRRFFALDIASRRGR
ncbi:TfuA-like protein [Actinoplanes sp. NBRC 103695]|uniref:TfuA-like protein n=1 Tax=Actinoplanes sp. NBRC 103695 TaxID=3032202 RepID=UPI0024A4D9DE|nr:TfuA-like protein [Actinoplanes sp. NBRC 103695]GLY94065.1 hypothetical protein Acsp02_13210 [Actinoplanes sp. NBRC 103695]